MNDDPPPLSEPAIIPSVFLTGCKIEIGTGDDFDFIRIVGWEQLPEFGSPDMKERRIVLRAVMPKAVARDLLSQLRKAMAKGAH